MLAKVTDKPVEDVITDVAKRAGLFESALQDPAETKMPDPASHGYLNEPGVESLAKAGVTAEPGQDVSDWTVSWGQAGGGMYSTIEDIGRWAATGLGNALLPKSLGDQRLQTQPIPGGTTDTDWVSSTGGTVG